MLDALVTADIVTDDPDSWAGRLRETLELPDPEDYIAYDPPGRVGFREVPGRGFRSTWLRVQPSLQVAPTLVQLIALRPRDAVYIYLAERIGAQGQRPVRTHATFIAGDVEAVIAHATRNNVRHRVTAPDADMPFPRVWLGVTDAEPALYDPSVDAGLWTEVVPTETLAIPEPFDPEIDALTSDRYPVRVVTRRFLVADLETSIRSLEQSLAWHPTTRHSDDEVASATYSFALQRSADIEIAQPLTDDAFGGFARKWGPGPHAIVLSVHDLDASNDRLSSGGMKTHVVDGDQRRLILPAEATCGTPFELVQHG